MAWDIAYRPISEQQPVGRRAPDWLREKANIWPVGTWQALSGPSPSLGLSSTNTIRQVKTVNPSIPNLYGLLSNWCNKWLAPHLGAYGTFGVGRGGGHSGSGGYPHNDIFGWDIESREWSELHAAQTGPIDDTFGEYANGSSAAEHTVQTQWATPALPGYPNGILITPRSCASPSLQTPEAVRPYPRIFNFANGAWSRGLIIPENDVRTAWRLSCAAVFDNLRNKLWLWGLCNQSFNTTIFAAYDPLTNTWDHQPPANTHGGHGWNAFGIFQVLFHDEELDLIITFDFRSTSTVRYLKPYAPSEYFSNNNTSWTVQELGVGPSQRTQGAGVCYSHARKAGIWWGGGGRAEVYEFKHEGGTVGSLGVAGSLQYRWTNTLNADLNSVVPPEMPENSEQQYNLPEMYYDADDIAIAFTVTNVDGAVYGYRLR